MKIILNLIVLALFLSCAKRPVQATREAYTGKEIVFKDLYIQKEIAGNQKDSSFNYLNLVLEINSSSKVELKQLEFEGVEYQLDNTKLNYQLKIPSTVDLLNKRMKYAKLYFDLDQKPYLLIESPRSKEAIYLP